MNQTAPISWLDHHLVVTIVTSDGQSQHLVAWPFALIGSDASCDLCLDDERLPAKCFVVCLTGRGLLGAPLTDRLRPRKLRPIDPKRGVRLGRYRLRFDIQLNGSPARDELSEVCGPDASTRQLRWTCSATRDEGDFNLVAEKPQLLGRRAPSAIQVNDHSISAVHALVYASASSVYVVDLASRHGLKIDGQIRRWATLPSDQEICLGQTNLSLASCVSESHSPRNDVAPSTGMATTPGASLPTTDELLRELEGVRQVVESVTSENQSLRQQLDDLKADRDRMTTDVMREREQLTEANAALEAERELWLAAQDDAEREWQRRDADFAQEKATWQREIATRDEQHRTVIEDLEQREQQLAEIASRLSAQELDLAAQQDALEKQQSKQLEQRREVEQREANCLEQQQTLRRRESELEQMAEDIVRAQQALESETETLRDQRRRLEQDQSVWEENVRKIAEQLRAKQRDLKQRELALQRDQELLLVQRIRQEREFRRRQTENHSATTSPPPATGALPARGSGRVGVEHRPYVTIRSDTSATESGELSATAPGLLSQDLPTRSLLESPEFARIIHQAIDQAQQPSDAETRATTGDLDPTYHSE